MKAKNRLASDSRHEIMRILLLIGVLAVVVAGVAGVTISLLYSTAISETRERLRATAQSQARLIEAVAEFDKSFQSEYAGTPEAATLSQIITAHASYEGFGETGEFTLGRLEDGMIVFLLSHRHFDYDEPQPVLPVDSPLAVPMQRAVAGESGTVIGPDYRGVVVLAAYEPVAVLDSGIVAKIDLVEIQAPFVRAAAISAGVAALLIVVGAVLFAGITNPLLRATSRERTLWSTTFDSMSDWVSVIDTRNHRVLQTNQAGVLLFGVEKEELVGKTCYEIVHGSNTPPPGCPVQRMTITGKRETMEIQLPDNGPWVLVTADPVRDNDGKILSGVHVVRNIDARKKGELALAESEERFRELYEQAPIAYQSLDSQGNLVDVNTPWLSLLGYEREEVIGKWFGEFLMPDQLEHFRTGFPAFKVAGSVTGVEFAMLTKRGSHLQVSIDGKVGHSADGAFRQTHCVVHDVGAQRKLEAHLRQQQKLESIGTLASGVAHEINNPLMGMINYADLIGGNAEAETIKEYSQVIVTEGHRIATIVRDLLSFSRQDNEAHSPARIKDIIEISLSLVGSTLQKDQITLDLDVPDSLPTVKCRSQQIQQVVINLLCNARDALNERYPKYDENKLVRITTRLFEREGEDWIRTTIEDHGIGISEDVAQRIFDPFFTTKTRDQGTGLGLSVSFGIVREHHGELTVDSVEGEFTRFHMDLRVNNGWSHRSNQKETSLPGESG